MNASRDNIEHSHAKIIVSTLECSVSGGDTNDKVVGH
jgi:hypothetical protein